jgi:ribosomal protein L11 methylase PrmA
MAQRRYADSSAEGQAAQKRAQKSRAKRGGQMSQLALRGLVDSLAGAVTKLRWQPKGTEWAEYYSETNYDDAAFTHKRELVAEFLAAIRPRPHMVWDLGANTGVFSRIAAKDGIETIAADLDPAAVERNYLNAVEAGETGPLPLVLDLTNPSPGIGWAGAERESFLERGPVDAVFALALIHHLAISNNLPLDRIAEFFARVCRWLVIEFVPKSDSQVVRLLSSREDVFPDYTIDGFERAFSECFTIRRATPIRNTERKLYLMERLGR